MIIKKRFIIFTIFILLIIIGVVYWHSKGSKIKPLPTITVSKGVVVEKAQAIGYIKPKHSSTVKSPVDGVVEQIYHDAGDYVKKGEPLLKVKPEPEPADYAQAYETLQRAIAVENAARKNYVRWLPALKVKLITKNYGDYIEAKKAYDTAKEERILAAQKLALLDKGTTKVGTRTIANVVRSPFEGYILTRNVDVGDPVISLSSAQASTALFAMANMHNLMFEGSVDEGDAAKIHLQMPASITVAAMPKQVIIGTLTKIALQSEQESTGTGTPTENLPFNVSFRVQVTNLKFPQNLVLRSGYSATATIKIKTVKDVLVLPERILHFKGDAIYVLLPPKDPREKPKQRKITVGLSDGITAEITSGLILGEKVLDKSDVAQE